MIQSCNASHCVLLYLRPPQTLIKKEKKTDDNLGQLHLGHDCQHDQLYFGN